jgi:hypothetical protein
MIHRLSHSLLTAGLEVDHKAEQSGYGSHRIGRAFLMVCAAHLGAHGALPYAEMLSKIEVNAAGNLLEIAMQNGLR